MRKGPALPVFAGAEYPTLCRACLRTNYRDEITRMVEEQLFTFFLQVAERHGLYAQCSHWELKLVMRYHSQAVLGILRSWSEADSDDLDHIVHVVHQLIVGEISPRQ